MTESQYYYNKYKSLGLCTKCGRNAGVTDTKPMGTLAGSRTAGCLYTAGLWRAKGVMKNEQK